MEQKVSLKLLLHGLPKNSIVICRTVSVPAFGIVTKFYLVRVMLRGVQGISSKRNFNERIIRLLFQLKLIIFKPGNETLDLTKSDFSHRLLRHDLGTQPSMNEDACCLQQVTLRTILFTDVAVNIKNTEC